MRRGFFDDVAERKRFQIKLENWKHYKNAEKARNFEKSIANQKLKWYQKPLYKLYEILLKWKNSTIYRVYIDGEPNIVGVKVNKEEYYQNYDNIE